MFRVIATLIAALLVVPLGGLPTAAAQQTTGPKVVFHSDRAGGDYDLYIANADGSGLTALTANSGDYEEYPSWSPDGRTVAYNVFVPGVKLSQVNLIDVATKAIRPVTNDPTKEHTAPVFSPDGSKVAVVSRVPNVISCLEIFDLANIPGNGTIVVCGGRRVGYELPTWSPDGKYIMITVFDGEVNRYKVDWSNGDMKLLIRGAYTGVWSPDGSKVAFSRLRQIGEDAEQTFIANADGSNEQAITKDPTRTRRVVAWFPDGSRLLLASSTIKETWGLRTITLTGKNEVVFPQVTDRFDYAHSGAVR